MFDGERIKRGSLKEGILNNTKLIEEIVNGSVALADVGISVRETYDYLYVPVDPPADPLEYGYAIGVRDGRIADYFDHLYVWTLSSADGGVTAPHWEDMGQFPRKGIDGRDGLDGYVGRDGINGKDGTIWYLNAVPEGTVPRQHDLLFTTTLPDAVTGAATANVYEANYSGQWVWKGSILGSKGAKGADGSNGGTPYIGENGNWWINGRDTNVVARGKDGTSVVPHTGDYTVDTVPPFSSTVIGDAYIVTNDPTYGEAIYYHAVGGTQYDIRNWAALQGVDGKSAYEVAQDNGFVGTEQEWLDSLVGETGPGVPDFATGEIGDVMVHNGTNARWDNVGIPSYYITLPTPTDPSYWEIAVANVSVIKSKLVKFIPLQNFTLQDTTVTVNIVERGTGNSLTTATIGIRGSSPTLEPIPFMQAINNVPLLIGFDAPSDLYPLTGYWYEDHIIYAQETGERTDIAMSQAAVTEALASAGGGGMSRTLVFSGSQNIASSGSIQLTQTSAELDTYDGFQIEVTDQNGTFIINVNKGATRTSTYWFQCLQDFASPSSSLFTVGRIYRNAGTTTLSYIRGQHFVFNNQSLAWSRADYSGLTFTRVWGYKY